MPIKLMGIDRLRISNAFSTQTNKKCSIYCNNAKSTCFFIDVFLRPEHPTIFLNSSCPFRHLEDNSRYSDLDTMLTSGATNYAKGAFFTSKIFKSGSEMSAPIVLSFTHDDGTQVYKNMASLGDKEAGPPYTLSYLMVRVLNRFSGMWLQKSRERALARTMTHAIHNFSERRKAAITIQAYFLRAYYTPSFSLCRRRLKREFEELGNLT